MKNTRPRHKNEGNDKMVGQADIMTIQGNWPRTYCTVGKTFDPYEARAVENLIGTIIDLVQDNEIAEAVRGMRELASRFDTKEPPRETKPKAPKRSIPRDD